MDSLKYFVKCRVNQNPKGFVFSHNSLMVDGVEVVIDPCHTEDSFTVSFFASDIAIARRVYGAFVTYYRKALGIVVVRFCVELETWYEVNEPWELSVDPSVAAETCAQWC